MSEFLDRNHPVREILDSAAGGREPTSGQLDALGAIDLPTGSTLNRFRGQIASDARRVAELGMEGSYGAARELARDSWQAMAARMTPAEAAASVVDDPNAETLADAAARMFRR